MSTKTQTKPLEKAAILQTNEDMKTALLIVSVAVNLFLFTTWLVIHVDPNLSLMLIQTT